jgi:hypothetical protein
VRAWIGPTLIGLALVGLAPARAWACKPPWPVPIEVHRPTWSTALELVDEHIEIECDKGARRSTRCQWRAVYVYEGTPGSSARGELRLPTHSERDIYSLQLHVDGQLVLDERGLAYQGDDHIATLEAEDAGHVEVEVALDFDIATLDLDTCAWPAGFARHNLVSRPKREARFIVYGGGPAALPYRTQLQVLAPPGWHVTVDDGPRSRTRELDLTMMGTHQLHELRLENRPLAHGPFVAAGVGFGPQVRARLRAGWEFAEPPFLLYSLAIEGDAVEEMLVVPAVEVASPLMLTIIPSAGLGVGAPVMLLPDPLAGVRTQLSLSWLFVGLIGSVDVYPRPGQPAVRGALMLQVSI